MKIDSSQVNLAASHHFSSRSERLESVRAWTGPSPDAGASAEETVSISEAARQAVQADSPEPAAAADAVDGEEDLFRLDPRMSLVKLVVELLTGRQIKTVRIDDLGAPAAAQAEAADEFGLEYQRRELREESEMTTFSAGGIIRTADGKEIGFELSLTMARSYREILDESLLLGNAVGRRKDPLVLNFDGTAAELSSMRASFDLDGDGQEEDVPLLAGNRGYLALDLNRNGRVDSGKELFGPASGDGFADLAQYDADGNGWIDENDPVFHELRVWMPGSDTLFTLKEKGVGAIYLGRTDTPFALNDSGNNGLGAVRASGIYLREDGRVGTVQQIDLIV